MLTSDPAVLLGAAPRCGHHALWPRAVAWSPDQATGTDRRSRVVGWSSDLATGTDRRSRVVGWSSDQATGPDRRSSAPLMVRTGTGDLRSGEVARSGDRATTGVH